jgi:hypothetical protein
MSLPRGVTELVPDSLHSLAIPYELDGRVSSYPLLLRGWSGMQCYLLFEGDRALLVNNGYAAHEQQLLEQLEGVLGGRKLSLYVARVEYPSMCNAVAIAERFSLERAYIGLLKDDPVDLLAYHPKSKGGRAEALRRAEAVYVSPGTSFWQADDGTRELSTALSSLRIVPCLWTHDAATRTLFSTDMFNWVLPPGPNGPWVVDDIADDPTTPEIVEHVMTKARYWWLPSADTRALRNTIDTYVAEHAIERIAPDHGCVIEGPEMVARHLGLLDDLLANAPSMDSTLVEAGQWPFALQTA